MIYYRQCLLQRTCRHTSGNERQRVWIPEQFAIVGNVLVIKDHDIHTSGDGTNDGSWSYGWVVMERGALRLDEPTLMKRRQDYRYTRQASDI